MANIVLAHQRPESTRNRPGFRPERFIETPADTYTWIPFGGGTRRCLGAAFATTEMKVVLKTVLRSAGCAPPTRTREPVARRMVTLVPKHGTRVVYEGRRQLAARGHPRPRGTPVA